MRLNVIRGWLAIVVVGTFMGITGFMAIFPLISETNVALDEYSDFFAKTASVYTGIVGVVVGYYFGRSQQTGNENDKTGNGSANPAPAADV